MTAPALARIALLIALAACAPAYAFAQAAPEPGPPPADAPRGGGRRGAAGADAAPTSEQVYQMLDSFVMSRAQALLKLPDDQYIQFFRRMTQLQDLQRMHRRQRQRVLMELRRIVAPAAPADEAAIGAKIKELDDLEAQFAAEERQAMAAIDAVLDVKQRGQFRVFLQNMEQQKLDLLMLARQGRGGLAPRGGQQPIR